MDTIDIIRKMIESDINNSPAWYLLGVEYKKQKQYSQALQAFAEAIKSEDEELRKKILDELADLYSPSKKNMEEVEIENKVENIKEDENADKNAEISVAKSYVEKTEDGKTWNEEQQESVYEEERIPLKVINGGKTSYIPSDKDKSHIVDFEDVGGLNDVKDIIRMKIIKPFTSPMLFKKFSKKVGGGILLYGPPGCGKTFIAKATAGECNAGFIPVHITDILNPYLGISEQNVKDIFFQARAKKPCILFFDEIDTIGYNRSKLNSEHMRPVIDQLLTEIEGIDSNTDKLLIIGATNMPWDVDPAFKRPGRFDRTVFVQPPDIVARTAIFKIKLKNRPIGEIDYIKLAEQTELYSGADIENVVELATEKVINSILSSGVERPIMLNDLLEAISETKPSTLEWLKTIKNYVKYANQSGLYDDAEKFLSKYKHKIN
jgi:SpoVK/Ycf46/Vps4 family AAA+-type ATPase